MKKHLNVTQEECSHIYVTYYVNRFEAYMLLKDKNYMIFATKYTYPELKECEEFKKYINDWKLPVENSASCKNRRMSDITSGFETWSNRYI
jgi:hypothetical protein